MQKPSTSEYTRGALYGVAAVVIWGAFIVVSRLGVRTSLTPWDVAAIRFTGDGEIIGLGVSYLRTVGPFYGFYGLGMALYFATQGLGRPVVTVAANGLRLLVSASAALFAVYVLNAGALGVFMAIALGFVAYGGLNVLALLSIKGPGSSR